MQAMRVNKLRARCTLRLLDLRGCAQLAAGVSQGSHASAVTVDAPSMMAQCSGRAMSSAGQHRVTEEARKAGAAGLLAELRSFGCTVLD